MGYSVYGIATSDGQAIEIASQLKAAGFRPNDISVLFPDRTTTHDFAHEKNTKLPEGAVAGVSAGGAIGATLGWLVGIGSLAIPGLGPFVAAGPILAAMSGAAAGATVGGITGALVGMGFPEVEAKRYEGKLQKGNVLISVHCENDEQIEIAKEIYATVGADDIAVAVEAPVRDR